MTTPIKDFYVLRSTNCSLVLDCTRNAPVILYWGARLSSATSSEMLALLTTRQEAPASAEREAPLALSPEFGAGFMGNAGIQIHRQGRQWGVYSQITAVEQGSDNQLLITSACDATRIRICHQLTLDVTSDVLTATTEISNTDDETLWVERCDAPCIPLPMHYDKILGFEGRWANEFQTQHVDRFMGAYLRENRSGRTSHDAFPGVIIHTGQTNEGTGGAFGLHLGWSGNHRICIEEESGGRAYAQLGELFYPGELSLEKGESYCSPVLYGARSQDGFSGLSRCFHNYVRGHLTESRMNGKLKPVHFNTWEAMYFDLSTKKLCALADEAAAVGVERFVLDDGWFKKRNSDAAGLGDWFVDKEVFPNGLGPLITHVNDRGMEFGLWVEPEMVNPDSDLYRQHPDWVLGAASAPNLMVRNQLVLDLTRPEVQEYLYSCIDALVSEYSITYLKWDMNRNLDQPGGAGGRAVTHYQTLAFYGLLERLRKSHPSLEIESCASGGGRADFGVLAHTDRVWTSDSNDALDRLGIQKGFSFFFPPEFMGAHIGPYECHVTGRCISMATRAGVAMFGNMGIEANLLEMSDEEKSELKVAVALHKKHRKLIHGSNLVRLDLHEYESGFGIVAPDQGEALFSYALLSGIPNSAPGRLRFRGLEIDARYEVNVIWPIAPKSYSKSILDVINGAIVSGDALMQMGMQLPIMQPQNLLIIHLRRLI
ncbi:MAG: alpha-galactosidase [Halieaceae bacterium]|jgi:alpha-galactosidase